MDHVVNHCAVAMSPKELCDLSAHVIREHRFSIVHRLRAMGRNCLHSRKDRARRRRRRLSIITWRDSVTEWTVRTLLSLLIIADVTECVQALVLLTDDCEISSSSLTPRQKSANQVVHIPRGGQIEVAALFKEASSDGEEMSPRAPLAH